jgi:hypothetical protein
MEILRKVQRLDISLQARWRMVCSVELGIRWKFFASHAEITYHMADEVDKAILATIEAMVREHHLDARMSPKSNALAFAPTALGGLGLVSYASYAADLYAIGSISAVWPPVPAEVQENLMEQNLPTMKQATAMLHERQKEELVAILGHHEVNNRIDSSVCWHEVAHVTKRTVITSDAWP